MTNQTIKHKRSATTSSPTLTYGELALSFTGGRSKLYAGNASDTAVDLITVSNLAGLASNMATFLGTASSANFATALTDKTGYTTGAISVFSISPAISTSITTGSTSFDLIHTTATTVNAFGAATTGNYGYNSVASSTTNLSTGAVGSGSTKTLNLGTGGASGSTSNINIGSANGGATTINSSILNLTNSTSSWINYGTGGAAVPSFTTRSVGTKEIYFVTLDGTHVDYARGIASSVLYDSIPQANSGYSYKLYGGTTNIFSILGDGFATITGNLFCGSNNGAAPSISGLAGTWLGWNLSGGGGESVFGNYRQGGSGGFAWRCYQNDGTLGSSPMYLTAGGYLTLGQSGSRLGVATSTPSCPFHTVAAGTQITSYGDTPTQAFIEGTNLAVTSQTGNLIIGTNTAQAVDVGGSITFGGKYNDSGQFACWATIKAGKANSSSGDYGGYLALCSRTTGQNITEGMRILANQNVAIGAPTASERLQVTGNILGTGTILSSSSTLGIGYTSAARGAVTQATSKTTGVTVNTVAGVITMNNAALAASATVTFIVTNSTLGLTDGVVANSQGNFTGKYRVTAYAVAAGSFEVSVTNISGSSQSEAVAINFKVIR